jgi:hypothetical protein
MMTISPAIAAFRTGKAIGMIIATNMEARKSERQFGAPRADADPGRGAAH